MTDDPTLIAVQELRCKKWDAPMSVVTIHWDFMTEDGDGFVDRAVQTKEQYDAVMQEFLAMHAKAYRPR